MRDADLQLAGGTESMSRAPYVNRDLRFGMRMRNSVMIDSLMEGLTDPYCHLVIGQTANCWRMSSRFPQGTGRIRRPKPQKGFPGPKGE